jgi:hypothetical protein
MNLPAPMATDAEWIRRAQISVYAHNLASERFDRRNGLANATILGGVVALGQVALVADVESDVAKVAVGVVTALLTVLGALALLWDFRGKALQHRFAARQYAVIRRNLELLSSAGASESEAAWRRQETRRLWDVASSMAPDPPGKLREKAREQYAERATLGNPGRPPVSDEGAGPA